jgi:RNA polymerase sigma-70 factor (ECF subfamily)
VFDYSLEEIAELVDSTVGGVKAALSRGRSKLTAAPAQVTPPSARAASAERARLLHLYVERFNRRDWDGLRELIAADARVRVADRFAGRLDEAPYFGNWERMRFAWRMVVADVDGEPVIMALRRDADTWMPNSVARLEMADDDRITRIVDYAHCPWILPAANTAVLHAEPS